VPPAVIETFFLPENDPSTRFSQIIDGAENSIYLCSESFNSAPLAEKLIAKKKSGIDIKVFVSSVNDTNRAVYEDLKYNGIDVLEKKFSIDQTNSLLNFAVIDNKYLILPIASYFGGVASSNDSFSFLIDSTQTAAVFKDQFNYIYSKIIKGMALRGYVRDKLTGKSIHDVKLTIRNSGSVSRSEDYSIIPDSGIISYTDKYGIYSFKSLGTSEILVTIEKDNFFSLEKLIEVNSTMKILDFELKTVESSGSLRGKIENHYNSSGIENIDVYVEYIELDSGIVTQVHEKTGPDGWFKCDNVPIGNVRIRVVSDSYVIPEPFFVNIKVDEFKELDTPIKLIPKYKITAIPNPIFPDNIFVTIKSYLHNSLIPEVMVTQKDYVPIKVAMRYVISGEQNYTVFTGAYRIKNGYWGTAIIDIDNGKIQSEFNIGFIEAGSRYTFLAPAKTTVELYDIEGKSGVISAFPARIETFGDEFSKNSGEGITINGPTLLFSEKSEIIIDNNDEKLKIYKKIDEKYKLVESRFQENLHIGKFMEYGSYYLLEDVKGPSFNIINDEISITDNGSGVEPNSIYLSLNNIPISFASRETESGIIIKPILKTEKISDLNIMASDRVGNKTDKSISLALLSNSKKMMIYPNPLKFGENIVIRFNSTTLTRVYIKIYDSSQRVITEQTDSLNSKNHIFNWNIRNKKGRMVSNGTYFVLVKDLNSNKTLETRKLSILK
jgi:hypothetical protein